MTPAFQQQAFALDARYNALRASGSPNFRELSSKFSRQIFTIYCYRDFIHSKAQPIIT